MRGVGHACLLAIAAAALPLGVAASPPLVAERFAVAASDERASRAGVEILELGGNAADAAVAAALAQGVVHPWSSGLGGGGFALVYRASDRTLTFLDFRETAPAAATRQMFLRSGPEGPDWRSGRPDPELSRHGGLAVAVPGEPAGLAELSRRFGRLGLARAAGPAIRLAETGVRAGDLSWLFPGRRAPADPGLARLFFPGGRLIEPDATVRNAALARTLLALSRRGPDVFYRGPIGRAFVVAVRAAGGILTQADLASYRVRERQPLVGRYRDLEVVTAPPPSSGGVVLLEALAMLEPHSLAGRGSFRLQHLIAEALKPAFADRAEVLGDPDFVEMPVARLLDAARLRARAGRIRADRVVPASEWLAPRPMPDDAGTTHISVVDAEGNAVALTTTINLELGAGISAGATGIIANDEMDDFTAAPGAPNAFGLLQSDANAIAPGKRPLSSMSPTIVLGPGGPLLVTGAAGGPRIISAVLQILVSVVDLGMDAGAAVAAPRVHHQWMPDELVLEPGVPADACRALAALGHRIGRLPRIGSAQAILVRRAGGRTTIEAASDPRLGGAPAGR